MADTERMPQPPDRSRSIRSYVLRAGRITDAQQRALAQLWPRFGIEFNLGALDLERVFARQAPCTLEIGFGNGEHLLERALASRAAIFSASRCTDLGSATCCWPPTPPESPICV